MAFPVINRDHIKGGAVGLGAGAAALAAVFIPHWESGGSMDTTVRHQSFDPPGVYTVCDGITNLDPEFAWIRPGMVFSKAKCAEAFQRVLPTYVDPLVKCMPSYSSMPPHRQVALLSAAYNLGPSRICNGPVAKEMNDGNIKAGCKDLGAYIKANGKVLSGLVNRRFDSKWGEIAWCLRDD